MTEQERAEQDCAQACAYIQRQMSGRDRRPVAQRKTRKDPFRLRWIASFDPRIVCRRELTAEQEALYQEIKAAPDEAVAIKRIYMRLYMRERALKQRNERSGY